jgi:hypothetical protein
MGAEWLALGNTFLDWLKAPTKTVAVIFITSGLAALLPVRWLARIHLVEITTKYQTGLWIAFVTTGIWLAYTVIHYFFKLILAVHYERKRKDQL